MSNNKKIGKFGEQLAADFLIKKKFRILEKNFFAKTGEIDIIAEKDRIYYFIEVKTRKSEAFGRPEEAVNGAKKRKLHKTALVYLAKKNLTEVDSRFGVVSISMLENSHSIEWFENVFEFF